MGKYVRKGSDMTRAVVFMDVEYYMNIFSGFAHCLPVLSDVLSRNLNVILFRAAVAQLCSHCSDQNNQESCRDQQCFKIPLFATDKHLMRTLNLNPILVGCQAERKSNYHHNMSLQHLVVTWWCLYTANTNARTDSETSIRFFLPWRIVWHRLAWQLKVMMSVGHGSLWD